MLARYIGPIILIVICLHGDVEGARRFWNGRRFAGTVGEPGMDPPPGRHIYKIKEQWTPQRVDNFNKSNTNTWQNRYFVNQLYYQPGGPVFLLLRGEDRASAAFMVMGAWVMYAKIFGAMCFQLEHRFYGKSFPTSDLSVENLRYLSSEQALADTANFIQTMTTQYNITQDTPWIIFGGSYAGALSVWLAEMYPHLILGVVSSSGPINPTVNYIKYLQAVSTLLNQHSPVCASAIKSAFQSIKNRLNGGLAQQASLYNPLQLCDTAIHASELDKANLLYTLTGDFMYSVQYNNDNTNNNYASMDVVCNIMTNTSIGTAFDRFAQVNNLILQQMGDNCVDFKYEQVIHQLHNTSINATVAYGGDRQWTYQTCNEFGYFQTSQSQLQVFGNEFPLSFFINQCTDVFGPGFMLNNIQQRVQKTNVYYGALSPHVTNVMCVQGSSDPWHLVGYYKNLTLGMNALFIPGTAHCADMYQPSPKDSMHLRQARNTIIQFITDLLYGNYTNPMPQNVSAESAPGSANGISIEMIGNPAGTGNPIPNSAPSGEPNTQSGSHDSSGSSGENMNQPPETQFMGVMQTTNGNGGGQTLGAPIPPFNMGGGGSGGSSQQTHQNPHPQKTGNSAASGSLSMGASVKARHMNNDFLSFNSF